MCWLRAAVWVYATFALIAGNDALEINIRSGRVRGTTQTTVDGKQVDAFLGIPYGAPTSGRNRFAPPKEAEPWDDTFDATKLSRPCHQIVDEKFKNVPFLSSQEETEDCLKLNVWVPNPRPKRAAVMVWIHGGGFCSGSSDVPLYDGAVLSSQEEVIVVSVNYRLSAFGFLYMAHPLAPGNVGLMDQALALQWVQKNIKAFGGDPNRVTIFGESAGGASVIFQLLAPSSLDLFQNAIAQSGTADDIWAVSTSDYGLKQAVLLAERAGCPHLDERKEDAIRCLQDLSIDQLRSAIFTVEDRPFKLVFRPVIDGTFLPSSPPDLLNRGNFCGGKNILLGHNQNEGGFVLPVFAPYLEFGEETLYTEEEKLKVFSSLTKLNEEISGAQLDSVKYIYTDWESHPYNRTADRMQLLHYASDRWFVCGCLNVANKATQKGNKVFFYRFDHSPANPCFVKLPRWMGSVHGDEIPFVFGHPLKSRDSSSEETKLAKQIMRYWANFAKHGDPNDDLLPTWPRYTLEKKERLRFHGKGITLDKVDRLRQCAFWEHVFDKAETSSCNEV